MKRLFIGIVGSLYFLAAAEAQSPGDDGIAPTFTPLQEVEKVWLGPLDNEVLLEEELQNRAPGRPPHFALPVEVDITPQSNGLWEKLPDGREVWRLRISSPGAHSLNFGFLEYYMPPGGRLFVYGPGRKRVLGPFTAADNEIHYQLWTPILPGDEAVLEVQLPARRRQSLRLRLATVNHDFLGFAGMLSGACNLDVICSDGDGWGIVEPYRDAIQSVAAYGLGGSTFCTGFLVNNTRNDCTPYFITANHCGINASNSASVVIYWNYQNSYCREPGSIASEGPGDGQLNIFNTGAIYRAGYAPTDFTLVELDDPVAENSQAFFAGWTRDAAPPEDTLACIHHPDGSEKRISFSFSDTYAGAWGSGSTPVPGGNHLIIPSWDIGSTESGSSGAPLFGRQRRVVGQLRGGAASCNNDQYDAFGWFRFSWAGGGTPSTCLKNWLDPDNTNLLFIDGRRLSNCNASITVPYESQEACVPGTTQYSVQLGEGFSGPVFLSTSGLPSGISAAFSPNPVSPGGTAILSLNIYNASISSGIYPFAIHAQSTYSNVETEAVLVLLNQLPPAPAITAPSSGAMGQTLAPAFQWTPHPLAASYELQVATDSDFTDIAGSASGLPTPYFQGLVLEPASTYFLRARGHNVCGTGPWSATVEFTTAAILCQNSPYSGPPVLISPQGTSSVTSTIRVESAGAVAGIAIRNLDIGHSYVGDLSAYLESPSGTIARLFNRPGFPGSFFGCPGANLMLSFADDALRTAADLESACNSYPAISGTFQPIDDLSVFIGEPAEGEWKLTISDHFDQDGGQANGWVLELCSTPPSVAELFPLQEEPFACIGTPYLMGIYVGSGFSGPVTLNSSGLPPGADASFSNNPAMPGSFVTFTVDSIALPGNYLITIVGTSAGNNHLFQQELEVSAFPSAPALVYPADGSTIFENYPMFSWSAVPEADTFIIQIATGPAFQEIVRTARVTSSNYTFAPPLANGIYFWRVLAENACGASNSGYPFSFSMEGSVTGIEDDSSGQQWRLFPNPTDGRLHIRWEGSAKKEHSEVEVFTIEGQLLLSREFEGAMELSLVGRPAGIYLVVLRNRWGVEVQRVVVR